MKKLNVVYCGTPEFSVPTLDMLNNHPQVNLVKIVSMPDRPAGRGQKLKSPEVIEYAKLNKIPFAQAENINKTPELLEELESSDVDLIIVLAFAQFLGKRVLNLPKIGCFNIHTSLLPKYRGAAPIQYALLNGDKTTGVSIQKMVKKMDAGDLVISDEIDISNSETGGQLYTRLKLQAALSINKLIEQVMNDEVKYTEQDHDDATFAPTLKKEDGLIDFSSKTFAEIKNQIRALSPWPGTYCFLNKKRLKVFNISKSDKKLEQGATSIDYNEIIVGCKDCSIRLFEVQLEGKKRCSDIQLLNGLQNKNEEIVINP